MGVSQFFLKNTYDFMIDLRLSGRRKYSLPSLIDVGRHFDIKWCSFPPIVTQHFSINFVYYRSRADMYVQARNYVQWDSPGLFWR